MSTETKIKDTPASPERLHLAKLLGTLQEKTFLAYWTGDLIERPDKIDNPSPALIDLRIARKRFHDAMKA